MDRTIAYAGQIPLDVLYLQQAKNGLIGVGHALAGVWGNGTVATGLACTPGTGLSVTIGLGSILELGVVDTTAYGTLGTDSTSVVQQYLLKGAVSVAVSAGTTTTIYAFPATVDTGAIVLPYYNASNPSQPYAGSANSGTAQPTLRTNVVTIGTSNSSGAIALYTVTVPSGASSISAAMIGYAANAPFYPTLPVLATRSNFAVIGSSQTWVVPAGVWRLRVRLWAGGGGGGGSYGNGSAGSGGGGGGFVEGVQSAVTPGQQIAAVVGAAGLGSIYNSQNATAGGNTTFLSIGAVGGAPGAFGNQAIAGSPGGGGGGILSQASAGFATVGVPGGTGYSAGNTMVGGQAGYAFGTGPIGQVTSNATTPQNGQSGVHPGQAGGGGVSGGSGGNGAAGLILVDW